MMMGMRDRIKAIVAPPVTAEWVDFVVSDLDAKADLIEETRGVEAADRYRERTGKWVQKMNKRGIIPPAE